eukprot:GHVU01182610.1.p3 GENE.GHVU01182610.1~~GHVU01182610.1.p3  ORF type:complete len:137 (-),score=15.60 GHVU01182610.1:525-935(-)
MVEWVLGQQRRHCRSARCRLADPPTRHIQTPTPPAGSRRQGHRSHTRVLTHSLTHSHSVAQAVGVCRSFSVGAAEGDVDLHVEAGRDQQQRSSSRGGMLGGPASAAPTHTARRDRTKLPLNLIDVEHATTRRSSLQ